MPENEVSKLKACKIQRTYFKNSKYTLTLFIPPVETLVTQSGYNISPIAILYFALPWKESAFKRSIEIRIKNQRKILRCLSEALNWFDSISDLFVMKDDRLYFNTTYNDLVIKYKSDPMESPQGFKIVPVALESAQGQYEEGVILSMNNIENTLELTRDELQELFDILYGFNFGTEIQLTYQALLISIMTNRIGNASQNYNNRFLK